MSEISYSDGEDTIDDVTDTAYDWVKQLSGVGAAQEDAVRRLHALMIRAARYKLNRMGEASRLGYVRAEEIVQSSADEAVIAILNRLDTFEGRSLFTTWAYKFAILHTATAVRRELWSHTEIDLAALPDPVSRLGDPAEHAESSALAAAIRACIRECLTAHQQRVFVAIAVEGIPIDVIADRLKTSRNTVYKTLYDARRRLREGLTAQGYLQPAPGKEEQR